MTAVGDKRIVATQTLLLEDGEVGKFDVSADGFTLPVQVRFRSPNSPETEGTWVLEDGVLHLEFTGWRNPRGSSFGKAKRIGDFRGVPLGFNLAHQRLGEQLRHAPVLPGWHL